MAERSDQAPASAETARPRPRLVVDDAANVATLTGALAAEETSGDPIRTARGFALGIVLAIVFWVVLGIAIRLLMRR